MKMINADQITTNMNGSTLEIFIDGNLAAEISDGRTELGFVYDVLQGMGYEINEDNFVLRAFNPVEELYTYRQSQQICMQTGFIGYMRADFGSNGKQFFSSWNEFNKTLKTPEFAADLDFIINGFRDKDSMFSDREKLNSFCTMHPEWKMGGDREYYGVRVDTTNYAYMLRFTPRQGDYNIYCHCYKKEWLDKHLENAERGISFIDPNYKEQFKIPDGESIRITYQDGTTADRTCRYIDDYHLEVGSELYHICHLPLYAISNFSTAAINCNLLQYSILSAVIRAVGVWSMSMAFLLISMFCRNALVPFVADFGVALCLVITGALQSYSSNIWLKVINPYSLLANRVLLSKTEFICFAGYPIQSFLAAIIFTVIVGLAIITAMLILSKRNYHCRERGIKCLHLSMN